MGSCILHMQLATLKTCIEKTLYEHYLYYTYFATGEIVPINLLQT